MKKCRKIIGASLLFTLLIILFQGCALHGTSIEFNKCSGSITSIKEPEAPEAPDPHFKEWILDFPSTHRAQTSLQQRKTEQYKIWYPDLRLQTLDEVIDKTPDVSSEITVNSTTAKDVWQNLKSGKYRTETSTNKTYFAVFDLKNEEAQQGASGRLAADLIYRAVTREARKYNINVDVVDKDRVVLNIQEHDNNIINKRLTELSEQELIKRSPKYHLSTYLLSGAVTFYSLENRTWEFPYVFDEESYICFSNKVVAWWNDYYLYTNSYYCEYVPQYKAYEVEFEKTVKKINDNYELYIKNKEIYDVDYCQYTTNYNKYVSGLKLKVILCNLAICPLSIPLEIITFGEADPWFEAKPYSKKRYERTSRRPSIGEPDNIIEKEKPLAKMPVRYGSNSLWKFFEENNRIPKPIKRTVTVGNVAITIRFVDAQTGDIIWIGNGSVRSTDLQKGMDRICNELVKRMFINLESIISSS